MKKKWISLMIVVLCLVAYLGWSIYRAPKNYAESVYAYAEGTEVLNDKLFDIYKRAGVMRDSNLPGRVYVYNSSRARGELKELFQKEFDLAVETDPSWTYRFVPKNQLRECRFFLGSKRIEQYEASKLFFEASLPSQEEFDSLVKGLLGLQKASLECKLIAYPCKVSAEGCLQALVDPPRSSRAVTGLIKWSWEK